MKLTEINHFDFELLIFFNIFYKSKVLQLIQNSPIDYSILQKLYEDDADLQKAWPGAKFPLCPAQWNKFLSKSQISISLLFKYDERYVGHLILLDKGDKQLFLCFVIMDKSLRGRGLAKEMLRLTEDFVVSTLEYKELWLHVDPQNLPALHTYQKQGYEKVMMTDAGRIRMRKEIPTTSMSLKFTP